MLTLMFIHSIYAGFSHNALVCAFIYSTPQIFVVVVFSSQSINSKVPLLVFSMVYHNFLKVFKPGSTWLALLVRHATPDLRDCRVRAPHWGQGLLLKT